MAIFLIALATSLPASLALAKPAACDLQEGCIGHIKIGDSVETVEKLIGRKVDLQFAGNERAGLSLASIQDVRRLGITLSRMSVVVTVDVFFDARAPQSVIDMVSIGVPCEDVPILRTHAHASGVSTTADGKGGWRVDVSMTPQKYVWGADTAPVCRFWLRGEVQR